jgi:hypothetical protein
MRMARGSAGLSRNKRLAWLPKVKVVSVGVNPKMLWLREAILQSAAFSVFSTSETAKALKVIQTADCGALLVTYALPEFVRYQLAGELRKASAQSSQWLKATVLARAAGEQSLPLYRLVLTGKCHAERIPFLHLFDRNRPPGS